MHPKPGFDLFKGLRSVLENLKALRIPLVLSILVLVILATPVNATTLDNALAKAISFDKKANNVSSVQNADGTETTTIYTRSIFFRDSQGNLQATEKTFKKSQDQGFDLENGNAPYKVSLKQKASGNFLRFFAGNQGVLFKLVGANPVEGIITNGSITYQDAWSSADLQYILADHGIKSNVILKDKNAPSSYSFQLETHNIALQQNSDKSITFVGENDQKPVFFIPAPYMEDNLGNRSEAVTFAIETTGNVIRLNINADPQWLAQAAYPVVIDPTILLQPGRQSGMDAYITSEYPSVNRGYSDILRVGHNNTTSTNQKLHSFLKFDLSSIKASSVVQATLKLYKISNYTSNPSPVDLEVRPVNTQWLEDQISWDSPSYTKSWKTTGGDFSSTLFSVLTADSSSTAPSWYTWDVTQMVNSWLNNDIDNNGFLLKTAIEDPTNPTATPVREFRFASSDYQDSQYWPVLEVKYTTDITPPIVDITSPSANTTVNGDVQITGTATDASGVTRVELYVDSRLEAVDLEAPYVFTWKTNSIVNGEHNIELRAYDSLGNIGSSSRPLAVEDNFSSMKMVNSDTTTARIDVSLGASLPMSSSQNLVGVISSPTSPYQPYLPQNIVDGNDSTYWRSVPRQDTNATYDTVTINFGTAQDITVNKVILLTPTGNTNGLNEIFTLDFYNISGQIVYSTPIYTLVPGQTQEYPMNNVLASSLRIRPYSQYYDTNGTRYSAFSEVKVISTEGVIKTTTATATSDFSYSPVNAIDQGTLATSTAWRSVGRTSADYIETLTVELNQNTQIFTVTYTPDPSSSQLKASLDLLDVNNNLMYTTEVTRQYTNNILDIPGKTGQKIRLRFTNLALDSTTGLYYAGISNISVSASPTPTLSNATASSTLGYGASFAADGDIQSYWQSKPNTSSGNIESLLLNLTTTSNVNTVYIKPHISGLKATIYVSSDGTSFTQVLDIPALVEGYYNFSQSEAAYVRLDFTNLQGTPSNYFASISEVGVYYRNYVTSATLNTVNFSMGGASGNLTINLSVSEQKPAGTNITYNIVQSGSTTTILPGANNVSLNGSDFSLRATFSSTNPDLTPLLTRWSLNANMYQPQKVFVSNPYSFQKVVEFSSPAADDIVQGVVALNYSINIPDVTMVEFLVDGQVRTTLTKPPYSSIWWDTTKETTGKHNIALRVTDSKGQIYLDERITRTEVLYDQFDNITLVDSVSTASLDTVNGKVILPTDQNRILSSGSNTTLPWDSLYFYPSNDIYSSNYTRFDYIQNANVTDTKYYWSDGGRDAFDGFGYPRLAIKEKVWNSSTQTWQEYTVYDYLPLASGTTEAANSSARVTVDRPNRYIWRLRITPLNNSVAIPTGLTINGNLGSDSSTYTWLRNINFNGYNIPYSVSQDSSVLDSYNYDPRVIVAIVPSEPSQLGTVSYTWSGDNGTYTFNTSNGSGPFTAYISWSYLPTNTIADWIKQDLATNSYQYSATLQSVSRTIDATSDRVKLVADQNTPTNTRIDYTFTADGGTHWETINPGVDTAIKYPGTNLIVKANLSTSDYFVTPEIRSWTVLTGKSDAIKSVDVQQPAVWIENPPTSYVGTSPITISAKTGKPMTRVEFYLDGILQLNDTTAPYSWTWGSPSVGGHTITVKAYDAQGQIYEAYERPMLSVDLKNSNDRSKLDNLSTTAIIDADRGIATLPSSNWWNLEWSYRRALVLTNSTIYAHSGEPVRVTVNIPNAQASGSDLRLIDNAGKEVPFFLAEVDSDNHNYTLVFETGLVPASSQVSYYIYYGNSSAPSASRLAPSTAYSPVTTVQGGQNYYDVYRNDSYLVSGISGNVIIESNYGGSVFQNFDFNFPWSGGVTSNSYILSNGVISLNGYLWGSNIPYNSTKAFLQTLDGDLATKVYWNSYSANGNFQASSQAIWQGSSYTTGGPVEAGIRIFPSGMFWRWVASGSGTGGVAKGDSLTYQKITTTGEGNYVFVLNPLGRTLGTEETFGYSTSAIIKTNSIYGVFADPLNLQVNGSWGGNQQVQAQMLTSTDGYSNWQSTPVTIGSPFTLPPQVLYIVLQLGLSTTSNDIQKTPVISSFTIKQHGAFYSVSQYAPVNSVGTPVITVEDRALSLSWSSVDPNAVYQVHRNIVSGFNPEPSTLISTTTSTSFRDVQVVPGTRYYYRIIAAINNNYSNPSTEVSAIPSGNALTNLGLDDRWAFIDLGLPQGGAYLNASTGNLVLSVEDSVTSGPGLALSSRRTYNSTVGQQSYSFGKGWELNSVQTVTENGNGSVDYREGDGTVITFTPSGSGQYTAPAGIRLTLSGSSGNFMITRRDGIKYTFNAQGLLDIASDRNNNQLSYQYDALGKLIKIADVIGGHPTDYIYGTNGFIKEIRDGFGRTTTFGYDSDGYLTSVIDPAGNSTIYSYDSNKVLSKITNAKGNSWSFTYSPEGRLLQLTDGMGNKTAYSYVNTTLTVTDPRNYTTILETGSLGNLQKVTDPLNNSTSYTYDNDLNLKSVKDAKGNITSYDYDSLNNLTSEKDSTGNITTYKYDDALNPYLPKSITNPDGGVTNRNYDANGNLLSSIDPTGFATSYTYDSRGRLLSTVDPRLYTTLYNYNNNNLGELLKITDAQGGTTTYTYDNFGYPSTITDPLGLTTKYTYDLLGRLVSVQYLDNTKVNYQLDAVGNLISATDENAQTTKYKYDVNERVISVIDPLGNTTTYTYDQSGNRTKVTDPNNHSTIYNYDGLNRLISTYNFDYPSIVTSYQYDQVGNNTVIIDPTSARWEATYNTGNQLISTKDPLGNVTKYGYDANGRKTKITDPKGNVATNIYDKAGRLVGVIDALNHLTSYSYDNSGNLISVKNPSDRTTSYEYDPLGRLKKTIMPDGNYSTNTYDARGRMIGSTDFNGQTTTYIYDKRGRLILAAFADGSSTSYTYDSTGRRLTMTDSGGVTKYSYDAAGRLTEVTNSFGQTTNYTYDAAGNITSVKTAEGYTSYGYLNDNRIYWVTSTLDNIQNAYSYDDYGRVTQKSYYSRVYIGYDGMSRINSAGGIGYTFDANGNRLTSGTNSYSYDPLNRVSSVNGSSFYTYDEDGNRMAEVASGSGASAYLYDENSRLVRIFKPDGKVARYTYDKNGNQTSVTDDEGVTNYKYDAQNRLVEIIYPDQSKTTYTYNGDGQRISMVDKNQEFYYQYALGQIITVRDGSGTAIVSYIRDPYGYLISARQNGQTYYFNIDALGSVTKIRTANGTIVNDYQYDAYGNITSQTEQVPNVMKFTGVVYDSTPGLYQMGARYYNPKVGRFITQDDYPINPYEPWTQNLYTYANNNPVNMIDPTGHFAVLIPLAVIVLAYLGETALETVPDVGLDYAISKVTDEEFDFWSSAKGNYGWNLIPIAGGIKTVKRAKKLGDEAIRLVKGAGELKNIYRSIKEAPNFPDGFIAVQSGLKKVNINNGDILDQLRKAESVTWKKVYQDGYDVSGREISIHYFESASGKVFDVKIKSGWSNLK